MGEHLVASISFVAVRAHNVAMKSNTCRELKVERAATSLRVVFPIFPCDIWPKLQL